MGLLGRLTLATSVIVATAVAHDAWASVSIAVPFDTLVQASTAAAIVTPVAQTSAWESGRIFTYTDVHVDTAIAGDALPDTVTVRTMGGAVGHIGQQVEGEAVLTVGRPSLLFLHPSDPPTGTRGLTSHAVTYAVTARAQGQFPLVLDAAGERRVRRSSGIGAIMLPKVATVPVLAGDVLHQSKVADAIQAIVGVWSRVHAP